MNPKFKRVSSGTALFLALAMSQTYLSVSFAGSNLPPTKAVTAPQQQSGVLTTSDNKPIAVNGASVITGATILSGATLETSDQVRATANLPGQARLDIAPNSKVTVDFNPGYVKVTVFKGCAVLHTMQGTCGEIFNANCGLLCRIDATLGERPVVAHNFLALHRRRFR